MECHRCHRQLSPSEPVYATLGRRICAKCFRFERSYDEKPHSCPGCGRPIYVPDWGVIKGYRGDLGPGKGQGEG